MADDAASLPGLLLPAPRPCKSCPYRLDVPAGVWHREEYEKLPLYDKQTPDQPLGVFRCHQNSADDTSARVCAGWAHVHGRNPPGYQLLALRMAPLAGVMTREQAEAVANYSTDVRCFASGAQAAEHGINGVVTDASLAMAAAIVRRRPDTARWRRGKPGPRRKK